MTKKYLIHAWCDRPFITYLDEVEAETPEEAIAIARQHPEKLLDAAEECNATYLWDEFAAYNDGGNELLRILDDAAQLRAAAPSLRETLRNVAQVLADFRPDFLRQVGLNATLEQVEAALAAAEPNTILTVFSTGNDER